MSDGMCFQIWTVVDSYGTVDLKGHARPPMPVLQERQLAPIYCPRCSFMLLALTSHCLFFDCLHSPVRLGL